MYDIKYYKSRLMDVEFVSTSKSLSLLAQKLKRWPWKGKGVNHERILPYHAQNQGNHHLRHDVIAPRLVDYSSVATTFLFLINTVSMAIAYVHNGQTSA